MKKIICYISAVMLIATSLIATSCKKEASADSATLSVSPTNEIVFPPNATEEDEVELSVTTNTVWEVSSDASWCKGYKSGGKLYVVAEPNTTAEARTANLTITAGNAKPVTIAVSQGVGTLSLSESTWTPTFETAVKTIQIESNTVWTAVSGAPAWCTVNKTSGTGDSDLIITVAENKTTVNTKRTATITIKIGNAATKTISVTQDAGPAGIEAAKITGFEAGTNTASSLVFTFTGSTSLTPGTTINIVKILTGTSSTSNATTDLGVIVNGTTGFSLSTMKVVETATVSYVGVVFTVSVNGKTTVEKTLAATALFNSTTTAGKLRTAKTALTGTDINIPTFTTGTAAYDIKTSANASITLGAGVALTSTTASYSTTGLGVIPSISGATASTVKVTFTGTDPTSAPGTMTFSNVPLTCAETTYLIPSINVALTAIAQ